MNEWMKCFIFSSVLRQNKNIYAQSSIFSVSIYFIVWFIATCKSHSRVTGVKPLRASYKVHKARIETVNLTPGIQFFFYTKVIEPLPWATAGLQENTIGGRKERYSILYQPDLICYQKNVCWTTKCLKIENWVPNVQSKNEGKTPFSIIKQNTVPWIDKTQSTWKCEYQM